MTDNHPTPEERGGLERAMRTWSLSPEHAKGIVSAIIAAGWRPQPPERPTPEVGVEEIAGLIRDTIGHFIVDGRMCERAAQAILSRLSEAAPPAVEG